MSQYTTLDFWLENNWVFLNFDLYSWQKSLQFVSILGAGLLCGTALAITIPEGVGLLEDSWRGELTVWNLKKLNCTTLPSLSLVALTTDVMWYSPSAPIKFAWVFHRKPFKSYLKAGSPIWTLSHRLLCCPILLSSSSLCRVFLWCSIWPEC